MMKDWAVKVLNLSKSYRLYEKKTDRLREALSLSKKKYHRDYYALQNVSFSVAKGETVGIVGLNGSGKSTFLKILAGVLTPTEGSVVVNGKISALLELGAGFNPEYNGLENIYLNGTMMGYSQKEIEERLDSILDFAGIGSYIYQPVKTYSSGMFARLAFAVAINVEPEILIIDEILSVGDVRFQIKCIDKMKKMMNGGATVFFVSHDVHTVRKFCTKAIWLNEGILKRFGEVDDIIDEYLGFLKLGDLEEVSFQQKQELPEKPFTPGDNIAEVIDFKILDRHGNEISDFRLEEFVKVKVIYDVYEENIEAPVLGIAIRSIDDDYVCGLNTLLDSVKIPWKYGRNTFCLEYSFGVRALGGKYYFDAALFDKSSLVAINYKKIVKKFTVLSEYLGEGRFVIPHKWTIN